jgi:hypothetical protein
VSLKSQQLSENFAIDSRSGPTIRVSAFRRNRDGAMLALVWTG